MLLTEGDIGNVVAAAVGTREMPAFLKKFTEQGGLIYGIGPAISEYWTAWEMYDAIATLSEEDKATARRALSNTAKAYELFRKNVNKHLATDGMYILARSNEFIQFKGTDQLKVKIEGRKSTPAPQKSLSMSITTESDQRREFFDRFADSGYAIDKTSYDAVKRGIDKDWQGSAQAIDQSGYSKWNITSMRQFMIRRACKFLLYDEINTRGGTIFYALDGLTLSEVAQRVHRGLDTTRSKVPVCTSELREIFRMWAYLQNHVTFYSHLENSDPPWKISDKAEWSAYALHRAEKITAETEAKANLLRELRQRHQNQQYDEAIVMYHSVPAMYLKKTSLPFDQV